MKPVAGTYGAEMEPVLLHGYSTRWVRAVTSTYFRVLHAKWSGPPVRVTSAVDGGQLAMIGCAGTGSSAPRWPSQDHRLWNRFHLGTGQGGHYCASIVGFLRE